MVKVYIFIFNNCSIDLKESTAFTVSWAPPTTTPAVVNHLEAQLGFKFGL